VSTHKEADSQIPNYPRLPSRLICLLENVTLHADPETDEVYAQMLLLPIQNPVSAKLDFASAHSCSIVLCSSLLTDFWRVFPSSVLVVFLDKPLFMVFLLF